MPDLARWLAGTMRVACAPVMAVVDRVIDSADARRERARLRELNRLRGQFEGPEARTPRQGRTSIA